MDKIVLASNNAGKVREIDQLLSKVNLHVVPQSEFDISEVEETGLSFVENAIIKARFAAKESGLPAIADDSGLEIDALQGAPGIYSARYAGENATDQQNLQKLLQALQNVPEAERTARFQCLMVFMRHEKDPTPLIAQGTWEGIITTEASGSNGFGYDPVFYVAEQKCTSAQLPADVKNQLSHRAKAINTLVKLLTA